MSWLKKRRQQLNLSQDELTRELQLAGIDITRSTLSAWETGRNAIPLDNKEFRQTLSKILNLDVSEMLRQAGYEVLRGNHSAEAERAAHLIDKMKPEDRDKAIRILETLAG